MNCGHFYVRVPGFTGHRDAYFSQAPAKCKGLTHLVFYNDLVCKVRGLKAKRISSRQSLRKIEKAPRGIPGENSRRNAASSVKTVSKIRKSKRREGTKCPEK